MTSLGIDIGGSSVKAAAVRSGAVAATASSDRYAEPTVADLIAAIRITAAQLPGPPATRISVCVPGQMHPDGSTVRYSANIPALRGVDSRDLVRQALRKPDTPIDIVPDSIAAARGSWIRDPIPGRLLAVSLGTGVGAAVLDDGRPLRIGTGSGHLGQVDVSLTPSAPLGPDGGRGSLEAYLGLPALRRRFGAAVAEGLARAGENDDALRALARAIRIAHAIYTPDAIRLLGGVGIMLRPALPVLRRLTERDLTAVARPHWSLSAADDPYLAAIGAAALTSAT